MSGIELPSIQGTLSSKQDALRRFLFDKQIYLTGHKYTAIHITEREFDIYGDEIGDDGAVEIETERVVTMTLKFPDDVPIDQFLITQSEGEPSTVESSGVFFFQVLPIVAYIPFEKDIRSGDFFILPTTDEFGNIAFMVIRVSEVLGKFGGGSITFKKYLTSPMKGDVPDPIKEVVTQMQIRGIKWKDQAVS